MNDIGHKQGLRNWVFLLIFITMRKSILSILVAFLLPAPFWGFAQRRKSQPPPQPKDTVAAIAPVPVAVVPVVPKDSVVIVNSPKVVAAVDIAVVITPKDCCNSNACKTYIKTPRMTGHFYFPGNRQDRKSRNASLPSACRHTSA